MNDLAFFTVSHQRYNEFKYTRISGRYLPSAHVETFLQTLDPRIFYVTHLGESVENRPIHGVRFGSGAITLMGWSQMHGNESTTTKALFDFFSWITQLNPTNRDFLFQRFTFFFIPMLNPDGATTYTRTNANDIDLNRDAINRSQPESSLLQRVFLSVKPDYCLNLHDQRSIFSVGDTGLPARISFLAPAADETLSIPPQRKKAMQLICAMNNFLQDQIPGQVGTYDDAFNKNCFGDYFQASGVPTVLFEAGHMDYAREETRKLIFGCLLQLLQSLSSGDLKQYTLEDYQAIPQNKKHFVDLLIRNAETEQGITDVAIQYREELQNGVVEFIPVIHQVGNLSSHHGHREVDAEEKKLLINGSPQIHENVVVKEIMLNETFLSIKLG